MRKKRSDKTLIKIVLTIILVLYVSLMIVGAVMPNPKTVPVFADNIKYFHFFGFVVLTIIVFKLFEVYNLKYKYILSVVTLIFLVALTEFLQLFVSTRHFSYSDMLIDASGCILGFMLYIIFFFDEK